MKMQKIDLKIGGMSCSACSSGLEKALQRREGIANASVNLVLARASVEFDADKIALSDIEMCVKKAGFESLGTFVFDEEKKLAKSDALNLAFSALWAAAAFWLSMTRMGFPIFPQASPSKNPRLYAALFCAASVCALFCGRKILILGAKKLLAFSPDMNSLVSTGVAASFAFSFAVAAKIFSGEMWQVQNLYFESCATALFLVKIGKFLEEKNKGKTVKALRGLVSITPNHATVLRDGEEFLVSLDEIQVGDLVFCRPGEKIACDGVVLEGETHIDESFVTGESVPVKKRKGDSVLAGGQNFEGAIKFCAEKIGKNSAVSQIVHLVEKAAASKAPIAKAADKICAVFVPSVFAVALVSFACHIIAGKEAAAALKSAVSVLMVSCPCSLGLATPLAIVAATGLCGRRGILVKSGEVLENFSKVKTAFFDKTGTLTKGALSVSSFKNFSQKSDGEILAKLASAEKNSEHPAAKAILNFATKKGVCLLDCDFFESSAGKGIRAKIAEDEILAGNEKWLSEFDVKICESALNEASQSGKTVVFAAMNGKFVASSQIQDEIKESAAETIAFLESCGVECAMLTGDNKGAAEAVAKTVGIKKVFSAASPSEKARIIGEAKKRGIAAMCGDGINDSVSLVQADAGISLSSGTDIARDSADAILLGDDISLLADLLKISRKTFRTIRQNLFFSFFYNALMIPVAAGVFSPFGLTISPSMAALAMTFSSLTVVFNSLRITSQKDAKRRIL